MICVDEFLPCSHVVDNGNSKMEKKSGSVVVDESANDTSKDIEMNGTAEACTKGCCEETSPPTKTSTSVLVNIGEVYKVYAMEFAISLHSVIIGFSLGVTDSDTSSLVGLTIALGFHQFFEGIAMGLAAYEAKFSKKAFIILVAVFSLSIFVGGIIGINVTKVFSKEEAEKWEGYITGVPNAIAAGMLLHIGQEFLSKDLGVHAPHTTSVFQKIAKLALLISGGFIMAVIALSHEHEEHDEHAHE